MPVVLRSARLELREFTIEDWSAVHEYASRSEACRFQPWGPNSSEESRAFVEEAVAAAKQEPRTRYALAVVLAATGELIGTAELHVRSSRFRTGELAYIVNPDYWGQGYATEAARAVLKFGFGDLGLHRIFGTCDPRNTASARVLQKVGMTYEGRLRETILIRDGWRDSEVYSILEQEWSASAADGAVET